MEQKTVFQQRSNHELAIILFLLGLLFNAGPLFSQSGKKAIWIFFDSSDSLCVKPIERTFDFYRIKTKTEQKLETFSAYDPKYDKIFRRIPRHVHQLNRIEILELLSKFPQLIFANGLIWYKEIYPVTYIVEKQGNYYIRYRVEKGDVFD